MKGLDREQDAYDEGRRAAMRGETLNQYQPSYKRRPELWTRFQLGFLAWILKVRITVRAAYGPLLRVSGRANRGQVCSTASSAPIPVTSRAVMND